ncbi:MAG: hypothetical protein IH618_10775 [Ignavibacteriaceae bacterium]|nr:hypothetical protein [Ignavibacteriaceae bacterium]
MSTIKENIKDVFQFIIISFFIILFSPFLLFFLVLSLISKEKPISTNIPNLAFDVPYKNSYLPDSVTRYVRQILSEEYETLRSAFGLFSAKKVSAEGSVEVLHMKAETVYYLNPCGPSCCPPQLLFQINKQDYLYVAGLKYSHGLDLFADEEENLKPLFQNLVVIRSVKSHIPLQILGTGELLLVKEIMISDPNEPLVFTSSLKELSCTFLRSNELPETLTDKFTSASEPCFSSKTSELSWAKNQEFINIVICSYCGTELQLTDVEIKKQTYDCPVCCKQIVVQNN